MKVKVKAAKASGFTPVKLTLTTPEEVELAYMLFNAPLAPRIKGRLGEEGTLYVTQRLHYNMWRKLYAVYTSKGFRS